MPSRKTTGSARPGCSESRSPARNALSPRTEPDRQVDVARDDHERLADREDREDRRVEREVAQRVGLDEARLEDRRHRDQQRERAEDAELADAQDPLGEPARADALGGAAA